MRQKGWNNYCVGEWHSNGTRGLGESTVAGWWMLSSSCATLIASLTVATRCPRYHALFESSRNAEVAR